MKKGFSLLEATVVVFILGVMIYLASASFVGLAPKYQLKRAVSEVNSILNLAKYKAIFEGVTTRVVFDSSSYRVEKFNEELKAWLSTELNVLGGVTLQANNSPTFYPVGTVSNLATIYVFNSRGKYKITIAITGRVKTTML
jgi:Tfp pilus assembly protein FimT